jgi:hypothetical protein
MVRETRRGSDGVTLTRGVACAPVAVMMVSAVARLDTPGVGSVASGTMLGVQAVSTATAPVMTSTTSRRGKRARLIAG